MCSYKNIIINIKDEPNKRAIGRNVIISSNGDLVYAEFTGDDSKVSKDLREIVKNIKMPSGLTVRCEKKTLIPSKTGHYVSAFEPLGKGKSFALIYDENALRGKNANILIGRNTNEIQILFTKWLVESQPLPFPRGYIEDLKMDAEMYLFKILKDRGLITQISEDFNDTIQAYEISDSVLNAGEDMQKAILTLVKDSNLLEIDRVRKTLKEAPSIGEADPESARIFVSLRNNSQDKNLHVIEYDRYEDDAFCLVDCKGSISWESIKFEALFSDKEVVMLKGDEYKDVIVDVDGNISKKALAA